MIQVVLSIMAVLATGLYLLFFSRKNGRNLRWYNTLAVSAVLCALELFDLLAVSNHGNGLYWKRYAVFAESWLPATWYLFCLTCSRRSSPGSMVPVQLLLLIAAALLPVAAFFVGVGSFFYSPDFPAEKVLFLGNESFIFYIILLFYLVIGLAQLERTLMAATAPSRWKIKYEVLGAGLIGAYLIFYYGQALFYRAIDMYLMSGRSSAIIIAMALLGYSCCMRGSTRVVVSQQVAYRSMVILVVSLYAILLGLMGEGMKYFGNAFQRTMVTVLAFVLGAGVLSLLFSEIARRKVKIFLHRNFYGNKYDYRTQWLQFTDLLCHKNHRELLYSIIVGFTQIFGMGCGAIFFREGNGETYRSSVSLEMEPDLVEFRSDDRLVRDLLEKRWIVKVHHSALTEDKEVRRFFNRYGIVFIIPLPSEMVDGFIVLGKPVNGDESYGYEDLDLMRTLARQASSGILNLRLSEELALAREMEAMGKVSAFVIHDLKNLVYTISLIVENAGSYMSEPAFQSDMILSLRNTVDRMNGLISRLKHVPEKRLLNREPADLLQLLNETVRSVSEGKFSVSGNNVIAMVDREEVQKVALNLLLNAVEASNGEGSITVEVGGTDLAYFKVLDDGCGIAPEFLRNNLFMPFRTTKKKGLGIGLYQCKQIVEAHQGRIEVNSKVGIGTEFTVWLPRSEGEWDGKGVDCRG